MKKLKDKHLEIKEKICEELDDAYKKLKAELDYKGIIKVEDYRYPEDVIFGTKYGDGLDAGDTSWLLEDGDIYTLSNLLDEGFKVSAITGKEIFESGYKKGLSEK